MKALASDTMILELAAAGHLESGGCSDSPREMQDGVRAWKDPVVQALMNALDGKEYSVLHGWKSLPKGPASDVDIVVSERDLPALERALRRDCGANIAQVIRYEGGCGFFFVAVRETQDDPEFTQIDAATAYSRDGRILLDSSELLEGRWKFNGMWVVRPEAEFAYLLTKKICKRTFPAHQRERLKELQEALDHQAFQIAEDLLGGDGASLVIDSIAASDWNAIESNLDSLHRKLLGRASRRHPWNSARYWTAELKRAVWRWRNPTGLMLAVMGPDGSGKSTLIERLKKKAGPLFWWKAALFHFRPDVLGTTEDRGPVLEPHLEPPRDFLSSALKLGYYAADFCAGYVKTIRPGLIRSRLMIFDRYYHDLLVDQRRYRYSAPLFLVRLVSHLIPHPDMFLILDASEATIHQRKQELSLEELRRQRIAYRQFAAGLPNAVLLDGSAPPSVVARQAHRHIIDAMKVRYRKRRKAWFRDDRAETLEWLSLALSLEDRSYLKLSDSTDPKRDSFFWFRLEDGRGYLLPADSRIAARAGLSLYRPQRFTSHAAKAAIEATLRVGAGSLVLTQVHALDQGSKSLPRGLFNHLRELLSKQVRFAVSLGTPGPHRKPVIQLMEDSGIPFAFAKVGWNDATNGLICNEAETYRRLSQLRFKTFAHPELVHAGSWGSHSLTIQSGPPMAIANSPTSIEPYTRAVTELAERRTVRMQLLESKFGKGLLERTEAGTRGNRGWLIKEGLQAALAAIGNQNIPFHLSHGDLAPWNACMVGGRLFLFDWEYSQWSAPAGWDLFHFFMQTSSLVAKRSAIEIVNDFAKFAQSIESYSRSVGLSAELIEPLFLLYIVDRLAWYDLDPAQDLDKLHLLSSIASLLALQNTPRVRAASSSSNLGD
jgi:thymidylate kinase